MLDFSFFEKEVTLFTYQNSLIGFAADCCCMRPANMEWHKLWWEWSRQRSHAVGIGEGMLRSIQAKGWGDCQCQGTLP